jgi:RNA polymerase sigma factor (TIGR02999 family)
MSDVTRILSQIEKGDPTAADQLLPLVYDELRKLAAAKLAREKPGQTLQATALVHEAYLRLVGRDLDQSFDSRGHFFAAAAEAIRRILIDQARRKQSLKRGGELRQVELLLEPIASEGEVDVLTLDEALDRLSARDSQAADLVKLRFFAGLTAAQSADALGISERTADRIWAYARSFLRKELDS